MDMRDESVDVPLRELRGFRLRWKLSATSSPDALGPAVGDTGDEGCNELSDSVAIGDTGIFGISEHDPNGMFSNGMSEQCVDLELQTGSPKRCSDFEMAFQPEQRALPLLDPQRKEPSWKAAAVEAEVKRLRYSFDKLPWEMDGTAFRRADPWRGTVLQSFDKMFATTCIGIQDVQDSYVVQSRPSGTLMPSELPVVPVTLKGARREPLDEDIRRRALLRFKDLVLQDPLATQLGTSLRDNLNQDV